MPREAPPLWCSMPPVRRKAGAVGFILGVPRSGTTLLSRLLSKHPEIYAPSEPWVMLALASLGDTHPEHPAGAELLQLATQDFLSDAPGRYLGSAAHAIYREKLKRHGGSLFVDKTPRYYMCAEFLQHALPGAKRVYIIRNPLDVAASYKNTWGYDVAQAFRTLEDHPNLFDLTLGLEAVSAERARRDSHFVRYEDLVRSPGKVVSEVLDLFGVSASMQASAFDELPPVQDAGGFGDPNIGSTTKVHERSIGSYAGSFSQAELRTILSGLGPELMEALGYGAEFEAACGEVPGPVPDRSGELRAGARDLVEARRKAMQQSHSEFLALRDRLAASEARDEQFRETLAGAVALEAIADERALIIDSLEQQLREAAAGATALESIADHRGEMIAERDQQLQEALDGLAALQQIADHRGAMIAERDRRLEEAIEGLAALQQIADHRGAMIAERDQRLEEALGGIAALQEIAEHRGAIVAERDRQLAELSSGVAALDQIAEERSAIIQRLLDERDLTGRVGATDQSQSAGRLAPVTPSS